MVTPAVLLVSFAAALEADVLSDRDLDQDSPGVEGAVARALEEEESSARCACPLLGQCQRSE